MTTKWFACISNNSRAESEVRSRCSPMQEECLNNDLRRSILSSGDAEFAALCAQLLSRGNSVRFKAHGSSMRPFIMDGDFITVVPVPASQLRLGDVAFYSGRTGALHAHRVLAPTRGGRAVLVVRGDSSMGRMERVKSDHILGRVALVVRDENSFSISRMLPRYQALLRLKGRQILHRIAPTVSRKAWNKLRIMSRIFTRTSNGL
jgi:hypothetical protein